MPCPTCGECREEFLPRTNDKANHRHARSAKNKEKNTQESWLWFHSNCFTQKVGLVRGHGKPRLMGVASHRSFPSGIGGGFIQIAFLVHPEFSGNDSHFDLHITTNYNNEPLHS